MLTRRHERARGGVLPRRISVGCRARPAMAPPSPKARSSPPGGVRLAHREGDGSRLARVVVAVAAIGSDGRVVARRQRELLKGAAMRDPHRGEGLAVDDEGHLARLGRVAVPPALAALALPLLDGGAALAGLTTLSRALPIRLRALGRRSGLALCQTHPG